MISDRDIKIIDIPIRQGVFTSLHRMEHERVRHMALPHGYAQSERHLLSRMVSRINELGRRLGSIYMVRYEARPGGLDSRPVIMLHADLVRTSPIVASLLKYLQEGREPPFKWARALAPRAGFSVDQDPMDPIYHNVVPVTQLCISRNEMYKVAPVAYPDFRLPSDSIDHILGLTVLIAHDIFGYWNPGAIQALAVMVGSDPSFHKPILGDSLSRLPRNQVIHAHHVFRTVLLSRKLEPEDLVWVAACNLAVPGIPPQPLHRAGMF